MYETCQYMMSLNEDAKIPKFSTYTLAIIWCSQRYPCRSLWLYVTTYNHRSLPLHALSTYHCRALWYTCHWYTNLYVKCYLERKQTLKVCCSTPAIDTRVFFQSKCIKFAFSYIAYTALCYNMSRGSHAVINSLIISDMPMLECGGTHEDIYLSTKTAPWK